MRYNQSTPHKIAMRYAFSRPLRSTAVAAAAAAVLAVLVISWNGVDTRASNAAADGTAGALAGAGILGAGGSGPIATEPNLKVALIGDTSEGANFQAVLNLIEAEGADIVLHQGDFDYANDPDGFFAVIDGVLGPTFPYVGSIGNHDAASWPEGCSDPDGCYATFFKQRMAATGITPDDPNLNDEMYSADFRGLGMVFVGESSAATGDCATNPNGYACYIRNQLQTDRHIWRICSWHKNQAAMNIGGKGDEMGWAVYNNCVDLGAIIATGHEHSYERTKTLTDPETQTVDLVQHPLSGGVPGNPNSLRVMPGASFVFVSGLGGNSMRTQDRCLPATYPYGCNNEWGSIYTLNQTNNQSRYGALFIEFYVDGDPYKARAYFKTTTGVVVDSFEIRADFQDADGDGIQNALDTCPSWANPAQGVPSWQIPAGDSDCDGYPDSATTGARGAETAIGTDPAQHCSATITRNDEPLPDAWPMDIDDNQVPNGGDILKFNPMFGAHAPTPPYDPRFDLTADSVINGADFLQYNSFFGKRCA